MFFGQHLEDEFINFIFSNIEKGVCIDVGAYDGINGSNTYFFEQKGWDCLCIEPIPDSFNKCNKVRKRTVKCCISNTDKPDTEFTVFALGHNLSAISSLIPDERLIESHKHLITDTSKISVSVRSLTSLLDEIGFNKTIDFISIDTENTELDVLKGIDFYKYDIKMLVIENNFNEPFCENYLLNCGYIKIKRIAVNDFYIKKYIPQLFNITAFYYIANYHEPSNVTNKLILLYSLFKLNNLKNTFVVSNELFGDTIVHSVKTLHINIEIINKEIITLNFLEGSVVDLNNIELYNINTLITKSIDVSIGEIIDKYSILELKQKYISNPDIISEVTKELQLFHDYNIIKNEYAFFYKLLFWINEQIWLDTCKIKNMNISNHDHDNILNFALISNNIFVNNQKRFILKSYFNQFINSNIKEQKSYVKTRCYIDISDNETIYDKIPEINYLFIEYDQLYFDEKYTTIIQNIFINPNKSFFESESMIDIEFDSKVKLTNYNLDNSLRDIFNFDPIKYISGGLIGDFINQLSVVNEKYYLTGRKGIVYIANIGDVFRLGVQRAYDDLYSIVSKQQYIHSFKIYNGENINININLSQWRDAFPEIKVNKYSLDEHFKNVYHVNWGNKKWINTDYDDAWSNKIVINTTMLRFITQKNIPLFIDTIKDIIDDCVFVSFQINEWEYFSQITGLSVKLHLVKTFEELSIIINSCKHAYLSLSSPQALANALHKNHTIVQSYRDFDNMFADVTHKFSHLTII